MSVYRMDRKNRVGIIFLAVFELLIGQAILRMVIRGAQSNSVTADGLMILFGLLGMLAIVTGVLNLWLVYRISLTINAKGLTYRNLGLKIEVPWNKVQITETAEHDSGTASALRYSLPAIQTRFWRPHWTLGRLQGRIPLRPFREAWENGSLRKEIQSYAPHLFDSTEDRSV